MSLPNKRRRRRPAGALILILAFAFAFAAGLAPAAHAQWASNGVPLCTATGAQTFPVVVSDGADGAIVAWSDERGVDADIYAQRVDASGASLWGTDGALVCGFPGGQSYPILLADGAGGAFLVWGDARSGSLDIYAQHLDAAGAATWTGGGEPVCTEPGDQFMPAAVLDGAGGIVLVWSDARGVDADLYAQRLDASGSRMWPLAGVPLSLAPGHQSGAALVTDGAGGAIAVWDDARGLGSDIYARHVDASGVASWTPDGVAVCTAFNDQLYPSAVSDGAGGVVVAWEDGRGVDNDIYAQAVTAAGTVVWTPDGVGVCALLGDQQNPLLDPTGTGDVYVVWHDGRSGIGADVYAQRLDAAGGSVWSAGGVAVCTAPGDQFFPSLATSAGGDALVMWFDSRTGAYDIMAQRLSPFGTTAWALDGVPVCSAPGDQSFPRVARDAAGGAVVAWFDDRAVSSDIYAQRVPASGITVDAVEREALAAQVLLVAPRPNPMQDRAMLSLWMAAPHAGEVTILDVAGRRVRRLTAGRVFPAGTTTLVWDGKTDAGVRAPEGVYFIRGRFAGKTVTQRVTVVR